MVKKLFFILFVVAPLVGMERPTLKRSIQEISTALAVSTAKKPRVDIPENKNLDVELDDNFDIRNIIDVPISQDFDLFAEFLSVPEDEDLHRNIEEGFDEFLHQQANDEEEEEHFAFAQLRGADFNKQIFSDIHYEDSEIQGNDDLIENDEECEEVIENNKLVYHNVSFNAIGNNVQEKNSSQCESRQEYEAKLHAKVLAEAKKDLKYPCPNCNKEYKSNQGLQEHIKVVHEHNRFICNYAGYNKEYKSNRDLQEHIKVVHENNRFICNYTGCVKSLTTKKGLEEHIKIKHKHGNMIFNCNYENCDKEYKSKFGLQEHINVHENNRFICNYADCNKGYKSKFGLRRHIKTKHEKIRFHCDQCDKSYTVNRSLQEHIKAKHPNNVSK